jgi:hypothetical protein
MDLNYLSLCNGGVMGNPFRPPLVEEILVE